MSRRIVAKEADVPEHPRRGTRPGCLPPLSSWVSERQHWRVNVTLQVHTAACPPLCPLTSGTSHACEFGQTVGMTELAEHTLPSANVNTGLSRALARLQNQHNVSSCRMTTECGFTNSVDF